MGNTVNNTTTDEEPGTVAKVRPSTLIPDDQGIRFLDKEQLRDATFAGAVALAADEFGGIVDAVEEIGDGFEIFNGEEKAKLVGVPMVFLEWSFNKGDKGRFVSIMAVAQNSDGTTRKLIINDGSTGIMEQLAKYQLESGRVGGLLVKRGLRASTYEFGDDGEKATTFYIAA